MKTINSQYHIQLKEGDIGRYVLLPGDPGRCERISRYLDNPILIASNREYRTYTGTLLNQKVSVTSTGIGCPSTAIAIEELVKIGGDTFIRVGTAGSIQPNIQTGDVAIISGSIRDEGTTLQYMPIEFPAVADLEVTLSLREAAQKLGLRHHLGIAHSKDSFYGEVEPHRMPIAAQLQERWKAWQMGGAIASEMETAVIFILGSIYRKRTGGVMLIVGNPALKMNDKSIQSWNAMIEEDRQIKVAIEAIKILIEKDMVT